MHTVCFYEFFTPFVLLDWTFPGACAAWLNSIALFLKYRQPRSLEWTSISYTQVGFDGRVFSITQRRAPIGKHSHSVRNVSSADGKKQKSGHGMQGIPQKITPFLASERERPRPPSR